MRKHNLYCINYKKESKNIKYHKLNNKALLRTNNRNINNTKHQQEIRS